MLKLTMRKGSPFWQITGSVPIPGGRHDVRESSRTSDRVAAEELAHALEKRIRSEAVHGVEAVTTFEDAALQYLADKKIEVDAALARGEKPPEPASSYLRQLIVKIGKKPLAKFSPGEVQDLAKDLHPKASAATRNRHGIVPFMAVYNFAFRRKLAPPMVVERFPEKKPKTVSVDRPWIEAVRAKLSDAHLRAMCRLMFETGMRIGTAIELEPEMVIHAEKVIRVPRRILKVDDEDHEFILSASMADELAALPPIADLNAAKGSKAGRRRDARRLFGIASRTGYYKPLRKACLAAGVPYVPPHQSGRHSFATTYIVDEGIDAVTTAAIGGWKDVPHMMKRYPHSRRAKLAAVVERVSGGGAEKLNRVK